jgi:dTDP-4-dehydrorhamnose reductase
MNKKVLVMGAGFLGKNIMNELKTKNFEVIGTTKTGKESDLLHVDMTKKNELEFIFKLKPEIVINCVAKTNVDYLEKNPNEAFNVNTNAVKNLAEICNQENIRLVHISTDSVFDGKKGGYSEDDLPNPVNVYSKSKLEGEKKIEKICNDFVIIRTNFYGISYEGRFLFEKIHQKLKNGEKIIGFDDIVFSPLEIKDLSKMIIEVANSNYVGILHLASNEFFSKYQFCILIAKIFGFDQKLIKKGSIEDVNLVAKRPKNTTLNNAKSKKIIKTKKTRFEEWLTLLKKSKVEIQ